METSIADTKGGIPFKVKLPKLHSGQIDVAKSNARFKVLVAGRRWGKTRLGVWLCIAKAMQGKKTWWVAPTYSMANEGWKEIRRLGIDYGVVVKEGEKTIYTPTGGYVTVRTADNPDRLRGAGLDFIVLDECAYIKEETWKEVLRPTLTERQGGALFISTPKGYNWFARIFDEAENQDDWERWQKPTKTNPLVPLSELDIAKKEIGSFLFSQEYEAQFVEQTGGLFKPEWFKFYKKNVYEDYNSEGYLESKTMYVYDNKQVNHNDLRIITTVDLATSTKESADFTVVCTIGVDKNQNIFVLDLIRKKLEAPDVLKLLEVVYEKWSPSMIGVESAGYQLALIQMLKRQTSLPITKLKADKDKLSRALPLSAKMESGLVYYSMDSLWYSDLEKEMLQFPAGEHDDQVDALAYGILQTSTRNKFKAY